MLRERDHLKNKIKSECPKETKTVSRRYPLTRSDTTSKYYFECAAAVTDTRRLFAGPKSVEEEEVMEGSKQTDESTTFEDSFRFI